MKKHYAISLHTKLYFQENNFWEIKSRNTLSFSIYCITAYTNVTKSVHFSLCIESILRYLVVYYFHLVTRLSTLDSMVEPLKIWNYFQLLFLLAIYLLKADISKKRWKLTVILIKIKLKSKQFCHTKRW